MAKQSGSIRFIGKVGNVVGYKNKDAAKSGTQFVRERVTEISNPKTAAQSYQRAKLYPAALFYNAFYNILNHAFLPSGSKGQNRQKFMQQAMKLGFIPDVMKGEPKLPFAPYQISRGSLGCDGLTQVTPWEASGIQVGNKFGIKVNSEITPDHFGELTLAEVSDLILADNPQLSEGMEITIIAIVEKGLGENPDRYAQSCSFVLDSTATATVMASVVATDLLLAAHDGKLAVYNEYGDASTDEGLATLAVGMIISSKTSNSWNYTNSRMYLTSVAEGIQYDVNDIVASYMDSSASRSSDLILQQADNTQSGTVRFKIFGNVAFELNPAVAGASLNFATAGYGRNTIGTDYIIVDANGQLQHYNGDRTVTPITKTVSSETTPVYLADTNLAGNPTVTVAELGF